MAIKQKLTLDDRIKHQQAKIKTLEIAKQIQDLKKQQQQLKGKK